MGTSFGQVHPPFSVLQRLLLQKSSALDGCHPAHFENLATTIVYNLQYQHDWHSLEVHSHEPTTGRLLPRPMISGVPPNRAYIHPDEQAELLKAEHLSGKPIEVLPEREWVLPTHIKETLSIAQFAEIFDAIETLPVQSQDAAVSLEEADSDDVVGFKWRGRNRQKRLLLATLHDDSTVVYYIMHDGIVKPRQN